MGNWFKYKIAWGILFIAFSLASYKVNLIYGERRVSFFEGMFYIFGNKTEELASSTIDQFYLIVSFLLLLFFFLVKGRLTLVLILFVLMILLLLGYVPFVYDEHPEIGF